VPRRLLVRLFQAAVVTALVGGTTNFVAMDKTVTLSVEGQATEVRSFGRTVSDVLEHEDIQVADRDLVVPGLNEQLDDGDRISVRFSRPVDLTVDGETRRVWTTARSVDEALMMFGIRGNGAIVSASRSARIARTGMDLVVRLPHDLILLADGKRIALTTTAPTAREALAEGGITLRPADRLNVDPESMPFDQQVLAVTRLDGKRVTEDKAIPFKTTRKLTSQLYKGTTRVARKGKAGARMLTYEETYVDGKLASRRLLTNRVAVQPVAQVLLIGTKPRPQNSPAADGLNWAALAQCESGGNPQAYNPAGPYYGLYQFSASTWHSVGGTGVPTDHSASEQTYRAQLLYRRSGAGQWPVCGRNL